MPNPRSLRSAVLAAAVLLVGAWPAWAAPPAAGRAVLEVAVQAPDAVWNAVAVDAGRVFLAGPRWTGSSAPPLVLIEPGAAPRPYPDAAWNAWTPGADPARAFVNINAIQRDRDGGLWVVDTGAAAFGGDPLPGGAKLVRIALADGRVDRVIGFGPDLARPGSYIDDVRFHGKRAYLTDAGRPGLIVVDLDTGGARRVLDRHASTLARPDRPIVLDGREIKAPDGSALTVHADPLEVSADGQWLSYGPLSGPWSRVPTRLLDDPAVPAATLAAAVEPWADLPALGGSVLDGAGNLYYSDLAANAIRKRAPDGTVTTLIQDPRLHWVDAPAIDDDGALWLPAAQIDRTPLFNGGRNQIQGPMRVYKLAGAAAPRRPTITDIAAMPRESLAEGVNRRALFGDQSTMAIFDLKAGAAVPEHRHPNEQVSYIHSGRVRVTVAGTPYEVRAGQVIVIPPNLPHSFVALEDTVNIDFFAPARADWRSGDADYFKPKPQRD